MVTQRYATVATIVATMSCFSSTVISISNFYGKKNYENIKN